MRKCDKKRINKLKLNQKLTKCQKAFDRAYANSQSEENLQRSLDAYAALSIGNIKLIVNNPERFGALATTTAATILTERLFQLTK
jgi:hypothetical protein